MDYKSFDVIIIGAGLAGIAFAKFYLDVHPDCKLLILEADACIGGSWNRRRLYKGFWTQTGLGLAEFSDMPMHPPPPGELHDSMFDAKYIADHLERYTTQHTYATRSLFDRVLLNFTVEEIAKSGDKWTIQGFRGGEEKEPRSLLAPKLVVANGLTSTPNMPHFKNHESFGGLIAHQKDFGSSNVLTSPLECITVLGGSKSAADMVYSCAKAGKTVTWLIRESGSGPAAFVSSEGTGRHMGSAEASDARILGTFSPSPFLPSNSWTRFLHRTRLGRKVVDALWDSADKNARAFAGFEERAGKREGFEKLKSTTKIFWVNDAVGIIQHPDFWDVVARNVHVERGDILELDKGLIRLTNGTEIPSDVLLCGTGWLPHHDFFSQQEQCRLGLPHRRGDSHDDDVWERLEKTADAKVLVQFPKLRSPPPHAPKISDLTAYRLYNGIAPLDDDSVVFLGHVHVPNAFRLAEYQALWATAYLDGKIPNLPSKENREAQIAFQNAWCRRRYLNNGRLGNYIFHDLIGYTDKLRRELGLRGGAKGWRERWFVPCTAADVREAREALRRRLSGELADAA